MSLEDFRIQLCASMVERLERPEMKILKAFDYDVFKNDMIKVVDIYKRNELYKIYVINLMVYNCLLYLE
ncbi:hypothetical protein QR665_21665 [Acinetobacter gerneri]|uniref:hypothetical protein n=1 Tax=Acinetobacter gerneri TaxID=202952 RepID=UPI0029354938|nr:hypothetical protein [Acinetobacter gerneri]MDV2442015.1 hypothetical protein [Acinetobacter gerneri]